MVAAVNWSTSEGSISSRDMRIWVIMVAISCNMLHRLRDFLDRHIYEIIKGISNSNSHTLSPKWGSQTSRVLLVHSHACELDE